MIGDCWVLWSMCHLRQMTFTWSMAEFTNQLAERDEHIIAEFNTSGIYVWAPTPVILTSGPL